MLHILLCHVIQQFLSLSSVLFLTRVVFLYFFQKADGDDQRDQISFRVEVEHTFYCIFPVKWNVFYNL